MQWVLYILGNLVGLGTPLTSNSPGSGQFLAEIIDVLISTWSLAVAGTVVGMVGALTFTTLAISGLEAFMLRRVVRRQLEHSADDGELDFEKLETVLREASYEVTTARAQQIFDAADKNASGTIDRDEVRKILSILESTGAVRNKTVRHIPTCNLPSAASSTSPSLEEQHELIREQRAMLKEQSELLHDMRQQLSVLSQQLSS